MRRPGLVLASLRPGAFAQAPAATSSRAAWTQRRAQRMASGVTETFMGNDLSA